MVFNLWFKLPQILRFLMVGSFNALLAYVIFCVLVYFAGNDYRQICLITQWIMTSFVAFMLYRIFVFQTSGNLWKEYLKCCATWIVGYFVNALFLEIFFFLGVNVYLSQLFAQVVAAVVTYFSFKYWAMKKR